MAKIDHDRAGWNSRVQADRHNLTRYEISASIAASIHDITKGMGKLKAEPCRRIDPASPEGRAIVAALPP